MGHAQTNMGNGGKRINGACGWELEERKEMKIRIDMYLDMPFRRARKAVRDEGEDAFEWNMRRMSSLRRNLVLEVDLKCFIRRN